MTEEQKIHRREYDKQRYQKILTRSLEWQKNNRERANANKRKHYRKHYQKRRASEFLCKYGITLENFNKLCEKQQGYCVICTNKAKRLIPDHNHVNEKFRGAVCYNCNIIMGLAKDNIETLKSAIKYLRKHNKNGDK